MTTFPMVLNEFPNMNSSFPFHLSVHEIASSFPSHRHDYLEFSFVIEGHGTEVVNGQPHEMKTGTFTFILPYQIHEIHSRPGSPLKLFNCIFGMDIVSGMNRMLVGATDDEELPPYAQLSDPAATRMNMILQEMLQEYTASDPWREVLLRSKLVEVLVSFDRIRQSRTAVKTKLDYLHRRDIWPIVHYVHTHYQDNITLTELSKKFYVSVPYLSELFKQHLGQNFVSFLHEIVFDTHAVCCIQRKCPLPMSLWR
jgi:hypothetical protein